MLRRYRACVLSLRHVESTVQHGWLGLGRENHPFSHRRLLQIIISSGFADAQKSRAHLFCEECLAPFITVVSPSCPLCRVTFKPKERSRAKDVEKQMASIKDTCIGCKKKMTLSKLRQHTMSCRLVDDGSQTKAAFKPVGNTSQKPSSNLPNRSTFQCPVCGAKNLDCDSLRRHCNKEHKSNDTPVVCPICASMPWGDPNYESSNFLHHMNLRHQFEYDTYVDYNKEEDDVLTQVLATSMEDK